ncbi:hypothetical protein PDK24_26990 [Bacillus cereus]|nr:hypothetical protein [Bacillus cereus]
MTKFVQLEKLTWDIFNKNGEYYDFTITQINTDGSFNGIFASAKMEGVYSEESGKITFKYSPFVEFTGYVFTDKTNPNMFTMAGTYKESLALIVPGTRNAGAFFAQINF